MVNILLYVIISLAVIPNMLLSHGQLSNDIGVQLSNTCVVMVKNNLTTNCPTYEEIMFLFPDSSDQRISGQFVFEDGYFHRDFSPYGDSYDYYRYKTGKTFWVDPPASVADRIKLIVIESRIDEYKIGNQIITNASVNVGYDSWVGLKCRDAAITAVDWQVRLGEMIQHIGKGCTSKLDNVKTKSWEKVKHDITTSFKYQLEKWIAESLAKCGQKVCFYDKDNKVQIYRDF